MKNKDLYVTEAIDGTPLDPEGPANPCGLIAYSVFNDSFILEDSTKNAMNVTSNGIAWPSDIELYKTSNESLMWHNTTDERFMVWMRVAALPSFRKVWGRINSDVPAGDYILSVTNSRYV